MNTALEQLEHWIEQYKRINGTPPINEILTQIDLLKDYEKEQCNIDLVSQQRELLAFRKWQKDNWKDVYLYSDEFMISEFKKANCG